MSTTSRLKRNDAEKRLKPRDWAVWADRVRSEGKTIATVNGAFDLLHAGHLYFLNEAKKRADVLLVALNSDESIQDSKSGNRPLISLEERLELMAALSCVDHVTWFTEPDPRQFLLAVRPDIHVNGAEYGPSCIEAETLKSIGAKLHLVPRIPGLSTSHLIQRAKQCD